MIYLLYFLAFSVVLNLFLYLVAYLLQTDKVTDISYTSTFAIIAVVGYYYSAQSWVDTVLLALVLLWAIRLGSYLFYRILQIGHDERFNNIRVNPISFLVFWVLQGLTCGILSFSFLLAYQQSDKTINGLFIGGCLLALGGLLIETIADQQKFNFKLRQPKAFMQRGLWRRLQHPNYTGELFFWWGIFVASLTYVNPLLSIIAPLWISLMIIRLSGIPILQKKWSETYGDDPAYQHYHANSWKLLPFIW